MKNQLTLIVAAKWQQFMNSRNIEEMLKLMDEQIEFVGRNESGYGLQEFTDWINRTGLTLTTLNSCVKEENLLIKHLAKWQGNERCLIEEENFYTVVKMNNGKIVYIGRFDNLEDAEEISGISLTK
jgi:hypothetical protein